MQKFEIYYLYLAYRELDEFVCLYMNSWKNYKFVIRQSLHVRICNMSSFYMHIVRNCLCTRQYVPAHDRSWICRVRFSGVISVHLITASQPFPCRHFMVVSKAYIGLLTPTNIRKSSACVICWNAST